jgi:hypothetical protein
VTSISTHVPFSLSQVYCWGWFSQFALIDCAIWLLLLKLLLFSCYLLYAEYLPLCA